MNPSIRILLPLLLALGACGPRADAHREPADARALDGLWAVDFTLESPLLPGHMPPQHTLRGQLALLVNGSLGERPDLSGPPTHSGSYTTRFRPFGFEIDGGPEVPALEARFSAGDSVEITLQPGSSAGVRMRGVLAGDSVAGTWTYDHDRGGIASGRFVMRRHPGE
jgi:hypothetical protein